MLDSRLLIFLKASEKLNFPEAAEELYLTQPTVTFQIKKLENYKGKRFPLPMEAFVDFIRNYDWKKLWKI